MLSAEVLSLLVCPACRKNLHLRNLTLICSSCESSYPILNGVPVLINENNSIFLIQDYVRQAEQMNLNGKPASWPMRLSRTLDAIVPQTTRNIRAQENYLKFAALLLERTTRPLVLVVGAGTVGAGMSKLLQNPSLAFVQTDVVLTPTTQIIVDGHDVPFAAESIDGVIIQAVLEHVVDPYRVVSEIHRVLKPGALVYAETPFMQQVHMGRHDFTRFTHLGHRRLFRHFAEIESGAACGTGTALAWTIEHFLFSLGARHKVFRKIITLVVRLLFFGFSYLDKLTIATAGSLDAASSYYFLGAKTSEALPDRELLRQYRGAQSSSL